MIPPKKIYIKIFHKSEKIATAITKYRGEINELLRELIADCFGEFTDIPETSECEFTIELLDEESFVTISNAKIPTTLDEVGIDVGNLTVPSAYGITTYHGGEMILGFRLEFNDH